MTEKKVYKVIKTPNEGSYRAVLDYMKTLGWKNCDMDLWKFNGKDTCIIIGNPVMQCGKGTEIAKYRMEKEYVTFEQFKRGVDKLIAKKK